MNYSSKKKQILALLAAVLVTAVLLLSGLFIVGVCETPKAA